MAGLGIWTGGSALIAAKFAIVLSLYAVSVPSAEGSDRCRHRTM